MNNISLGCNYVQGVVHLGFGLKLYVRRIYSTSYTDKYSKDKSISRNEHWIDPLVTLDFQSI